MLCLKLSHFSYFSDFSDFLHLLQIVTLFIFFIFFTLFTLVTTCICPACGGRSFEQLSALKLFKFSSTIVILKLKLVSACSPGVRVVCHACASRSSCYRLSHNNFNIVVVHLKKTAKPSDFCTTSARIILFARARHARAAQPRASSHTGRSYIDRS